MTTATLKKHHFKIAEKAGYSIYNRRCKKCGKLNLDIANACWNCGYEFPDRKTAEEKKSESKVGIWIAGAIFAIIIVAILLVSLNNYLQVR